MANYTMRPTAYGTILFLVLTVARIFFKWEPSEKSMLRMAKKAFALRDSNGNIVDIDDVHGEIHFTLKR
jgi:hypothetical protein